MEWVDLDQGPSDSITITLASPLLGGAGPGYVLWGRPVHLATIQPDVAPQPTAGYMQRVGTEGQVITFATGAGASQNGLPVW